MECKEILASIIGILFLVFSPSILYAESDLSTNSDIKISISTDKPSYFEYDVIEFSGRVSKIMPGMQVSLEVFSPIGEKVGVDQLVVNNDKTFSTSITAGGSLYTETGVYTVDVLYGMEYYVTAQTTFEYLGQRDTVPPLLLLPEDMLVDATSPDGATVHYSAKAIDDVDGVVEVVCDPPSGHFFPIKASRVSCSAFDSYGNGSVSSFVIKVRATDDRLVPEWIKDVAGFWCNDEIDDTGFVDAVQYLIDNSVIVISGGESAYSNSNVVPDWIKNNACWWQDNQISDKDFVVGLEYLVQQGIIQV